MWCRAVLLDDGLTRLVLMALDLLSTDFAFDDVLCKAVSQAAAVAAEHILINCSHTHAGPVTSEAMRTGGPDGTYLRTLPSLVAGAVAAAVERLEEARLLYGTAGARVGVNRRERTDAGSIVLGRNPDGIVDDEVRVLTVERRDEQPLAVLFQHACHGTTLSAENRMISAEWMGAACARLEDHFGAVPVFLQGCAGQTNPDCREQTFGEMERLGALAHHAVVRAVTKARPLNGTPLGAAMAQVGLPLQDPPDLETARAEVAKAEQDAERARREGAHPYWVRALEGLIPKARKTLAAVERDESRLTLPFRVQAMALGDLATVGLSGEVFLEFSRQITAQSPFPDTWALGYSNGCQCYVPTAEALAEGGYEGADSFRWYGTLPLASHAGEKMGAAAVRLLDGLRTKESP